MTRQSRPRLMDRCSVAPQSAVIIVSGIVVDKQGELRLSETKSILNWRSLVETHDAMLSLCCEIRRKGRKNKKQICFGFYDILSIGHHVRIPRKIGTMIHDRQPRVLWGGGHASHVSDKAPKKPGTGRTLRPQYMHRPDNGQIS